MASLGGKRSPESQLVVASLAIQDETRAASKPTRGACISFIFRLLARTRRTPFSRPFALLVGVFQDILKLLERYSLTLLSVTLDEGHNRTPIAFFVLYTPRSCSQPPSPRFLWTGPVCDARTIPIRGLTLFPTAHTCFPDNM